MLLNFQTHYCDNNEEWIVLFHGLGGNHSIFYKQIEPFKKHFNLLCIDFPGHGESGSFDDPDYLTLTSEKVIELMNHLKIKTAHFVGVSLGTIVMQDISLRHGHRIRSMVLAGAASKFLKWGQILCKLTLAKPVRKVLPYMLPYSIFAFLLMPKKNHRKARTIFIREAFKLGKNDYLKWAHVAKYAYKTYDRLTLRKNVIPKLYISGSEDHMFLKGIQKFVKTEASSDLTIIPDCGHVCNIEKAETFNKKALAFLKDIRAIHQQQNRKVI
ncbi:alpha/beta hydrolase [Bacillus sp. H-16]|uniref:alpha/beta fold hydrolase n=1 Tax=Alteribacter salitolerans TaxID=2912333 RepID=UPI001964561E|nr:alpha/beta hydrolase [Alteribacter salitolerans]MBM7094297.1 alpha/beta hydrolase [Alteribacter salitolerans]